MLGLHPDHAAACKYLAMHACVQYNKSAANSMSYQPSEGSRHPRAEIDVSELHEDLRELKEMVKGMQVCVCVPELHEELQELKE
eukprot:1158571-Pelagomonas_calceolata.AAC.4